MILLAGCVPSYPEPLHVQYASRRASGPMVGQRSIHVFRQHVFVDPTIPMKCLFHMGKQDHESNSIK
jgi:hypothetical protein